MQPAPESQRRNRRGERNQLLPLPLPKTSRVGDHLQKEDKRGWPVAPSDSRASGDWAESILSRALTRGHHCHRRKIGPCHTSKWDPATSCTIRPASVIDDRRVEYEGRQQRVSNGRKVKPF